MTLVDKDLFDTEVFKWEYLGGPLTESLGTYIILNPAYPLFFLFVKICLISKMPFQNASTPIILGFSKGLKCV